MSDLSVVIQCQRLSKGKRLAVLPDADDAMGVEGNEPFDKEFPQGRDRLIQLVVGLGRQVGDDQLEFDGRAGATLILFPGIEALVYLDLVVEQAGEQVANKTVTKSRKGATLWM